ncbi:MAG: TetR/AcrR family transcriptional regulator [Eubacterium sp.]|nr:TetR/AcrR family transcriptional regulator [Eubacterium sp.]
MKDIKNRKMEIITATLELAAERGLGTVSMQQIADKVGITKASLYNHFSSRDEIVEAMYEILREASKKRMGSEEINYDSLSPDVPLKAVLNGAVNSYRNMVSDPKMFQFYKVIMSERSINSAAADIMVKETRTMINATKTLFYALQVKEVADFKNPDVAAVSFAMTVHAILDHEFDLLFAGSVKEETSHGEMDDQKVSGTSIGTDAVGKAGDGKMMQDYIDEFCRVYSK